MHQVMIKRIYRDQLAGDERGGDCVIFWVCDYILDGLECTTGIKESDGEYAQGIDGHQLTDAQWLALVTAIEAYTRLDS